MKVEEIKKAIDERLEAIVEWEDRYMNEESSIQKRNITRNIKDLKEQVKFWSAMLAKKEEEEKTIGRPSLGVTKKVSVTLPEEVWHMIDAYIKHPKSNVNSMSAFWREMGQAFYEGRYSVDERQPL